MEWENGPKTREFREEAEMLKKKKKEESMFLVFLFSTLVSLCGGLLLTWWIYKFHPTNSQLWMVPPGLILFITPVFVSFSVLISDFCDENDLER